MTGRLVLAYWLRASVPLSGLLECPHNMAAKREQGRGHGVFWDTDLQALLSPHSIPLATQAYQDAVWEETTQRHRYQEARLVGAYHGGWLPHRLRSFFKD